MGSSIPLPALSVQAPQPQQSNPLQQYAQLMQLRQQQQNAPLQQQALQQQVQNGALEGQQKQIELQNAQQGQQDQQALRALATDPSNKGKTVGDLADIALQSGKVSPQTYTQLKKSDLEQRSSLESLTKEQLANADASHKQLQQIYDTAQDMTPEQLQQNWPAIAQQANSVHSNTPLHLDPSQPLTKQQLSQLGPMIAMQRTYLDEAAEKQDKKAKFDKDTADAKLAQTNADAGGTTDQAKTETAYLRANNLPDTPENRLKAFKFYNDQTKIAPAMTRANVYMQMPQAVFNPQTGQNEFTTRAKAIGQEAPSSADALAAKAGVQADAGSLKKMQASYDAVSSFANTLDKNIGMLKETAQKVPDLGAKFANVPVRMLTGSMIGTDNMAAFKTALAPVQSEAAKILNSPNLAGTLSDSARHEMEAIVDGNMPYSAMVASLNVLQKDSKNRLGSTQDTINQIKGRMGQAGQQSGNPAPARPQGVPANAVWNAQGHNGAGSWQLP